MASAENRSTPNISNETKELSQDKNFNSHSEINSEINTFEFEKTIIETVSFFKDQVQKLNQECIEAKAKCYDLELKNEKKLFRLRKSHEKKLAKLKKKLNQELFQQQLDHEKALFDLKLQFEIERENKMRAHRLVQDLILNPSNSYSEQVDILASMNGRHHDNGGNYGFGDNDNGNDGSNSNDYDGDNDMS